MSVSSDSTIIDRPKGRDAEGAPLREGTGSPGVAAPRITPTDGELLTLFTRHDDRAALDRLIDRHAAMVWRVCRTALRRPQDAEDAFQATFLLLVRQARSIKSSDSAAGWLYRVAYRTSLRARKKLASRREESLAVDPHAPGEAPFPDLLQRQTTGVLVEELMRLPAKYQAPLVMRYLEGQSRRAIADQTDTTIAAVQGRLARGKQMLRHRLLRRGVSLAGAMAALGLGARGSKAAQNAPPHLVASTTSQSVALAGGGSLAASAAVVTLYQEGARAMLMAWLVKPAASVAVAAAALLLLPNSPAGERVEPTPGLQLAIAVDDDIEQATPAPLLVAQADPKASRRRQSSEEPAPEPTPPTGVGGSRPSGKTPTTEFEVKAYVEQTTREALLNQLSFIPGVRVEVNAMVDSVSKKTKEAEASIVVPLSYAEGVHRRNQTNPRGELQATIDEIKRSVEEIAQPLLPKLPAGQDEYKQVNVRFVRDLSGGSNQQTKTARRTGKPIELASQLKGLEERLTAAASWTKDAQVERELEGLYQEVLALRREQLHAAATATASDVRAELTEIRSALGLPAAVDSTASRRGQSSEETAEGATQEPPTTDVAGSPTGVYGPLHVVGTYYGNDGAPTTVEVGPTDEPITLVLTSYYWQDWKLKLQPDAKLARVIVAGYNSQRVEGIRKALPDGVPLDVYTYFNEDKTNNKGKDRPYFWAYKKTSREYFDLAKKLKQITGREVASFTGAYQADKFALTKELLASRRRESSVETSQETTQGAAQEPPTTDVAGSPTTAERKDTRPRSRISHSDPLGGGGQEGGVNTVIHVPSELNPFGWTSIGHVATGGTIPILLPNDKRPRPVLRYRGGGTDDWLPLHIDAEGTPRHAERFQLKRDEPRLEEINGQQVQVWYRSIPADKPSISPYALVIVRGIPKEKLAEVKAGKLAAPSAKEALERVYANWGRNRQATSYAGVAAPGGGAPRSGSPKAAKNAPARPGASLTGAPLPPGAPTQFQTVAKPTDKSDPSQAGIPLKPRDVSGDKRPGVAFGGRNATYGYSVGQLQERLNEVLDPSPGLAVDGDYGPLTEAAVKRFQKEASLPESGFADELTRDALGFVEPGDAKSNSAASRRRQSSEEPAMQAGLHAPSEIPKTGIDGSPPDELLAKLRDTATYQAAPPGVQQEFEKRLAKESADAERRRLEAARYVVGQVVLGEGDEPELVSSQMEILPGGFFFDLLGDAVQPVAFRLHGYDPLDASVINDAGPITDLQQLKMTRTAESDQLTLTAQLALAGDGDPASIRVRLRTQNGPINTPSNGYEPRSKWSPGVEAEANEKGELRVTGLSPIGYYVDIRAEGHVSQTKRIDASTPGASDLGKITLERPKQVELEYVVYRYDDDERDPQLRFDEADVGELLKPKRVVLKPGEKFVSDPEQMHRGSSDFRLEQKDGKLTFRSSYGPFYSTDLGEKDFASYAGLTRMALTARDNPEIIDNHVYLLRSGYFDHYLLVRARVLKPGGERMSETDRQVARYNKQLDAAEENLEKSAKLRDQAASTKSNAVREALNKVAMQKAQSAVEICRKLTDARINSLVTEATEEAMTDGAADVEKLERQLEPILRLRERRDTLLTENWFSEERTRQIKERARKIEELRKQDTDRQE